MHEYDNSNLQSLPQAIAALTDGEPDLIANLAQVSALIYEFVPKLNWAGFYRLQGDMLVLGPFQGRPACVRIAVGKGVCGTAAKENKTIVVDDVHKFSGHIACDEASESEMVIPLHHPDGTLFGVLDMDSPIKNRFEKIKDVMLAAAEQIEKFL